jgi:hypothetical protein
MAPCLGERVTPVARAQCPWLSPWMLDQEARVELSAGKQAEVMVFDLEA